MNEAAPIAAASAVPVYAPAPAAAMGGKIGVLLVNLGTPDGADAASVRRYLKEFLSDPRVIENQGVLWQLVLNGVILPIRPRRKARDYAKIWNQEKNESPLKTITRSQAEKLGAALAPLGPRLLVDWAMRYGNPSIASRLGDLVARGCERILVIPLYPQYCAATTATVGDEVFRVLERMRFQPALRIAPPYYDDDGLYRGARVHHRRCDRRPRFQARRHPCLVPRRAAGLCRQGRSVLRAMPRDHAAAARAARSRREATAAHVPIALRPRAVARARDRPDRA